MKNCNICGAELDDNAPYCDACGTVCEQPVQQAQPVQPPQYPPPQPQYPPPGYYPQQMPVNPKYATIGGWLLFFVITLIITAVINLFIAIVGIARSTSAETQNVLLLLDNEWRNMINLQIVAYFILIGVAAFQIYSNIQIFTRKHQFLKIIQLMYFTQIAYDITILISYSLVGFEHIENAPVSSIVSIIGTVILLFIYTTYYCRSERVKTFMGGDDYKRNAIFSVR